MNETVVTENKVETIELPPAPQLPAVRQERKPSTKRALGKSGRMTMYQAITTKYLSPTNVRGSRVKAACAAGSITLHWDNRWNSEQNHAYAAMQLAKKLNWDYAKWHGGCNAAGEYVFASESETYFTVDYEPHTKTAA